MGYFLRNGPPAMDFQSGMSLPTSLFETFKHPLISPIARFFVSFPAIFLCRFPPGLTAGFLRNLTRNLVGEIVEKLNKEVNAALHDPKMKVRFVVLGGEPLPGSPAELAKLIADETEKWAKVIKFAGIKAE